MRREAAKTAHTATVSKQAATPATPATKAPAKRPGKATTAKPAAKPAAKAPAKVPAKKAAPKAEKPAAEKAGTAKLRWVCDSERGKSPQTATAPDGSVYRIDAVADGKWHAIFTPAGGKPEMLTKGVSISTAYFACVRHYEEAAAKVAAA